MKLSDLDKYLVALHEAYRTLTEGPDELLAAVGLGRPHHRVLFIVHRVPNIATGQLAERLMVTNQAMHKTLEPLARGGFIEARRDAHDGRVRCLRLTAAGVALEHEATGLQHKIFRNVIRSTGADKLEQWAAVNRKIAAEVTRGGLLRTSQ
jgi:DNA-binding MarR family transcriptional regulator